MLAPGARVCKERAVTRILDWLGTVLFAIFFGLILLTFDVLLRAATPFGHRAVERVGVLFQASLILAYRAAGVRVKLERSPEFQAGAPYIVLSNHQSMFDIPLFAWAMPENFPKYISKRSLAKWIPGISYNLRRGGHALIDRKDRNSAVQAIRDLARAVVADGSTVVIFPEGTRGRDGKLGPFKPGGSLALLEEAPDAPVVPVCIENSWKMMRHNFAPVPFGVHLRMWIGAPIERHPDEDRNALIARAEEEVRKALERMREEDLSS